jgi:hypothetical protein
VRLGLTNALFLCSHISALLPLRLPEIVISLDLVAFYLSDDYLYKRLNNPDIKKVLNYASCMKFTFLLGVAGLLVTNRNCFAQCKETISPSNHKKVHYHTIQLADEKEYLTLTRTGEERILSYHNERIGLVYYTQMFIEIRFSTPRERFSLYSSANDRSNWQPIFVLASPITPKELEKMKASTKIEVLLPEDTKVFTLDARKNALLNKAIACMR